MQLEWVNEACNAVWLMHQVLNWTSVAQFKLSFLDVTVSNEFVNPFFFFFKLCFEKLLEFVQQVTSFPAFC